MRFGRPRSRRLSQEVGNYPISAQEVGRLASSPQGAGGALPVRFVVDYELLFFRLPGLIGKPGQCITGLIAPIYSHVFRGFLNRF